MMDEAWKVDELEPGAKLDVRVRRRMRMFAKTPRKAAPFLPLERAVYAVVLAVYVLYSGARAVRVFEEARAPLVLAATPRERSSLPCERPSCPSWGPRCRWWT